ATIVSISGLALLITWPKTVLAKTPVPAALGAVILGIVINELVGIVYPNAMIGQSHRVELITNDGLPFTEIFTTPDWSAWIQPNVYVAAFTIAVVASLESLLNLEAVDRLDTENRISPPNRELLAQGAGNICAGLVGGLPVTSVIVRSSANVYSGAKTKASAIAHGVWLAITVFAIPGLLERIPLAALAAILLHTGYKLANPTIFRQQFVLGWRQFVPFVLTVLAIVMTDLLIGILFGLTVGVLFVLHSMERAPFLSTQMNPIAGNVTRLKFGQYLTFWNRSRIRQTLDRVPESGHVVLDASATEYIDPDIIEMIRDFHRDAKSARDVEVSLVGFGDAFFLPNQKRYTDVVTQSRQQQLTPAGTLKLLCEGNERFRTGKMIERDWSHQRDQTSLGQHPMAALVGCIDSRVPAELVFDVGIGDVFSVRVAGNVINDDVLGSLEYAAAVAGVRLIVVLGHTKCGAVTAACKQVELGHVTGLIEKIRPVVTEVQESGVAGDGDDSHFVDEVARRNVQYVVDQIPRRSEILKSLMKDRQLAIVGGIYDIHTGHVHFEGTLVNQLEMMAK
ncbi:MAG: carbonic anhydrase family protein, partial [Planctomycetota bacterium]